MRRGLFSMEIVRAYKGEFLEGAVKFRDAYGDSSAEVPISGDDSYIVLLQTEADRKKDVAGHIRGKDR